MHRYLFDGTPFTSQDLNLKRILYCLIGLCAPLIISSQPSDFIMVDQFGYLAEADKIAVIADPQSGFNGAASYSPGSTIEVRNAQNDQPVFSGSPAIWNSGNTHNLSGDRGWWFDFSPVTVEGSYYLYDTGTGHQSSVFVIGSNPFKNVLIAALRAFYYNRCNAAKVSPYAGMDWTDDSNFDHAQQDYDCRYIYEPNNVTTAKDLHGGWFDAGDYNKYVTFAHNPVHDLLWAYQENPALFGDDWNWPESGNNIPDILDEVQWELDWLMRMTNPDGTAHIKMGSNSYSVNISAPPSLNTDPRYYGPTCTAASIAVASMFAHASLVYESIAGKSSYADSLKSQAIQCWSHFLIRFNAGMLETACDDGSIIAGDADWNLDDQKSTGIIAAVYLFKLTGESQYHNFVIDHYAEVEPVSNNFWGPYRNQISEALLFYCTLPQANSTVKTAILNSASTDISNNYNGIFNLGSEDLYRVNAPEWMYHWGSNQPIANMGNLCNMMIKYDVLPTSNDMLKEKSTELVHYFHGINPMGLVYLSNMYSLGGDRCANEIYHTWFNDGTDWDHALNSPYGPAPGFVVGGPNKDFSLSSPSPPANQPPQKSYLDFNTGWPDNSWEITEPAIYYQAAYIRLLAHQVTADGSTTPVTNLQLSNDCIEIYPNPTNNFFHLRGVLDQYNIAIYSSNGSLYQTIDNQGAEAIIDMSGLPSGTFLIRVENAQNNTLCVQKILKQD
ncbi:MAG: glycoside hydrolase family 9 protein [Saprospiraceae bacterium]|nr:glycoside hydrolase family 9 protein [Saprospiraceae bacterium]